MPSMPPHSLFLRENLPPEKLRNGPKNKLSALSENVQKEHHYSARPCRPPRPPLAPQVSPFSLGMSKWPLLSSMDPWLSCGRSEKGKK